MTDYPTDADGRVVLEAPERGHENIQCGDGHVYTKDAAGIVKAWPFHVGELFGADYRLYVPPAAPDPAPVAVTTVEAPKPAKRS